MKKLLPLLVSFWILAFAQNVYAQGGGTTPNLGLAIPEYIVGTWGEAVAKDLEIIDVLFPGGTVPTDIPRVTVAGKPGTPRTNQVVVVTDAANATTCITGGGSSNVTCQWNGSNWVAIGGGGGGGAGGFDAITSGSNTGATMTCGTGCSIVPSGTGAITATALASGSLSSANLTTALTDETGSGAAVFATSPTLTTPTIASLTNAQHNHTNAVGGGQITDAALSSAVTVAKGGTGGATLTNHGVVLGQGTNPVAVTGAGTAGQVLTSNGASTDPTFQAPGAATAATADWSFTADISPAQITANQDNYAGCTVASNAVCRLTTDASRNITGITGGTDGRVLLLLNVGSSDIVLVHDSTSTAANRFFLGQSLNVTLNPNHSVVLIYDFTSSRWRVAARNTAPGLTAEADTPTTVYTRDRSYGGAVSSATAVRIGSSSTDRYHILYDDATLGLVWNCEISAVVGNCDKGTRLNAGKKWSLYDSAGAEKFTFSESTGALTNVTLNSEGNGNTITTVSYLTWDAAGCNNTTASPGMELPTSGAPTPTCFGTTTTQGTLTFADAATSTASRHFRLHPKWVGTVDIDLVWFANSSTSNAVRWSVATSCIGNNEAISTGPASYNAPSATNSTYTGTANQRRTTTFTTVAVTNCAGGKTMYVQVSRIGGDAGDTLAASAELVEVGIKIRHT